MAQTRAGAKALRNVLAWVAVLAGYKPTPAEEIVDVIPEKTEGPPSGAESATEKQVKAIHSIISAKKLNEEEIKQNLGIEHFSNLTKEQASDLISDLDKLDKEVKGEE